MNAPIRVLNIDDSKYVRLVLARMLADVDMIEVVGQARDGSEGLEMARKLQPDVITLDIEMPGIDGLEVLKRLLPQQPTPVVMLSSLTRAGAEITLEALSLGAVDFIGKPGSAGVPDLDAVRRQLVHRIRTAATATVTIPAATSADSSDRSATPTQRNDCPCVLIASSTGGPQTLDAIFSALPGDIPASFAVTQHIPPDFSRALAERLDGKCALQIRQANEGDMLKAGEVLIAPGAFHMTIGRGGIIHLSADPEVWGVRPAADPMMQTAAESLGVPLIALVLTGMGRDGSAGCVAVKKAGGLVFAEAEESCIIYGMPKAARQTGCCDRILRLDEIPSRLVRTAHELSESAHVA